MSQFLFHQEKLAHLTESLNNCPIRYPVVGVLEELNSTVAVLEHLLPSFFDGFTDLYERELKEMKKNHPKKGYNHLEGEARRAVAANLTLEIGFYQHLRQRLARQVKQLP